MKRFVRERRRKQLGQHIFTPSSVVARADYRHVSEFGQRLTADSAGRDRSVGVYADGFELALAGSERAAERDPFGAASGTERRVLEVRADFASKAAPTRKRE